MGIRAIPAEMVDRGTKNADWNDSPFIFIGAKLGFCKICMDFVCSMHISTAHACVTDAVGKKGVQVDVAFLISCVTCIDSGRYLPVCEGINYVLPTQTA